MDGGSSNRSGSNGVEEETKKRFSSKIQNFFTPRVEVALRISLTTLVASSLSLASLPNAIPPNLKSLIGVLAPYQSLQNPHTSCVIGMT